MAHVISRTDGFEPIDQAVLARISGGSAMDRLRQGYAIWKPLSFGFVAVMAPHDMPPAIMPTPPAIVRQIGER